MSLQLKEEEEVPLGLFKKVKKAPLDLSDWSLSDFGLSEEDQWAAFILARVFDPLNVDDEEHFPPKGYVSVIEPKFGDSARFKMPSGHRSVLEDKTPLDTAWRELRGETGIKLSMSSFEYIGKELGSRRDHWCCIFTADMDYRNDASWMNSNDPGNEGEKPKFFTVDEFYRTVREGGYLRNHFELLENLELIYPLGRDKI